MAGKNLKKMTLTGWLIEKINTPDWRMDYYDNLISATDKGNIPEIMNERNRSQIEYEILFSLLNALPNGENPVWKRVFSADVTGQSKEFERKYEKRIITILRKYAPVPDEEMEDDEVLTEFGILTYSQRLEWKGALRCRVDGDTESDGYEIDTTGWIYGYMMNAQSLTHATPVAMPGVKKVIIIENKANYESAAYDSEILYIYCHGFFSPKERRFLSKLQELAEEIEFYHWSDMDYGGIRIFQFIKSKIFSKLQPLHMNCREYQEAVENGKGIPLTDIKRKKLEQLEAGELEKLKEAILANGIEIEQELLL